MVEAEHALEVERAASVAPLAYTSASSATGRNVLLRGQAGGATGFGPGDAVDIAVPDGGAVMSGNVVSVDPEGLVVELSSSRQVALPQPGLVRRRVDDTQRTIRLRAIERVVRERHTLRWVGPVLTGAAAAALD